jgi:hypothetical protein
VRRGRGDIRNLRIRVGLSGHKHQEEGVMNGLIYLVGLIVVIMAILSLFGLR